MASPPPESIMQQFLPLLGLVQQKRAQDQTNATNAQRNKILALQAANQQEQLRQQAELNASRLATEAAALKEHNTRVKRDQEARDLLFGGAVSSASIGEGDLGQTVLSPVPGSGEPDIREQERRNAVITGDLSPLALLPGDELEESIGIGAKTRLGAGESRQFDQADTALAQQLAFGVSDRFSKATPGNVHDLLTAKTPEEFNAAFNKIEGDSTKQQALAVEWGKIAQAEYGTESANWRALLQVRQSIRTSGSAVQVAQIEQGVKLYEASIKGIEAAAQSLKIAEETGQGDAIKPALNAMFAWMNQAQLTMSQNLGIPFVEFEPGFHNPALDFSGPKTQLNQDPLGLRGGTSPQDGGAVSLEDQLDEQARRVAAGEEFSIEVPDTQTVQGPAPTSQVKSETATSRSAQQQPLGLGIPNAPIPPSKRSTGEVGTPLNQPITTDGVSLIPSIIQATNGTDVSPTIMRAIYQRESSNNPHAIGDNGTSFGLGQMKQAALEDTGLFRGRKVSSLNTEEQVLASTAYYGLLRNQFGTDERALVAYNLGRTKLSALLTKYGGNPGAPLSDIPADATGKDEAAYHRARNYSREVMAMTLADGGPQRAQAPQAPAPNTAAQSRANLQLLQGGFPLRGQAGTTVRGLDSLNLGNTGTDLNAFTHDLAGALTLGRAGRE